MTRALGTISLCGLLSLVICLGPTQTLATGTERDPWLAAAIENIQRSEYEFSPNTDGAWIAPSRAQGLSSVVSSDGLRIAPGLSGTEAWKIELQLVGFGRGVRLDGPGPVLQIVGDGNRVELQHEQLTEWYINRPATIH